MRLIPGFENALPLMALALVLAGFGTAFLTPYVRAFAHRLGVVDRPDPRRVNRSPVPRGGGLAVVAAFVPVAIFVTLLNNVLGLVSMPDSVDFPELAALLGGGILAAAIGALDDYFQLRARWQLAGQLALAILAVAFGITVDFINNPLGPGLIRFGGVVGAAFTVFWIIGMINSINFIDGLDGLSSGIVLIASVTLGIISLTVTVSEPYVAVLCFALAGALLGFLRWNFHPASIFVGTSGVMFIGYTLAILSILGTAKVAVAVLVLAVPIIDTFWIIVRRLAAHRSPFSPDRGHLHHRLLDVGLSHTQTVLLIYALCIALAGLSFVLSGSAQIIAFLLIVLVSGLTLFAIRRRNLGAGRLRAMPATTRSPGPRDPNWSPRAIATELPMGRATSVAADRRPPIARHRDPVASSPGRAAASAELAASPPELAPPSTGRPGSRPGRGASAGLAASSAGLAASALGAVGSVAGAPETAQASRPAGSSPRRPPAPAPTRPSTAPLGAPVLDPGIRAADRPRDP